MSRFVVIEGLDGAGTTTQTERLCAWLATRGADPLATREPTAGPVGRVIRRVLRAEPDAPLPATLPWLFAADRADHLHREIEPALAAGRVVVSDRYYHSSLAYQSLELPLARVHALNADFRTPDLTLFLDVSIDVCLARIGSRGEAREIFEQRDRLEQIDAAYREVLALLERHGEPIVRIDGEQAPDEVAAAIAAHVARLDPT